MIDLMKLVNEVRALRLELEILRNRLRILESRTGVNQ